MPGQSKTLEQELETYRKHLSEWADQEGQFVLIHESDVCGFYEEYIVALRKGYEQFGIIPFLVKKVAKHPQAHTVTRVSWLPIGFSED